MASYKLTLTGSGVQVRRLVSEDKAKAILDVVLTEEDKVQPTAEQVKGNGRKLHTLRHIQAHFGKKAADYIRNGREIVPLKLRTEMKKAGLLDAKGHILVTFPGTWPRKVYSEVVKQAQKTKTEKINVRRVAEMLGSTHGAVTNALASLMRSTAMGPPKVVRKGKGRGTRWHTTRLFSPSPRGG